MSCAVCGAYAATTLSGTVNVHYGTTYTGWETHLAFCLPCVERLGGDESGPSMDHDRAAIAALAALTLRWAQGAETVELTDLGREAIRLSRR